MKQQNVTTFVFYSLQSKLDRVRELYGGEGRDPISSEEDQVEYRVVPNTKRKAPSGFYGVRGRRAQQVMTSPDADDDVREASDLLQLMEFYRALHGTRPQTGGWIGCLLRDWSLITGRGGYKTGVGGSM